MDMYVGTMIKMERLKQKMKLDSLSKGICSVSHLSRIENGKSEPSGEILKLLSDRLGMFFEAERKVEKVKFLEFEELCSRIINLRDKEGAARFIDELSELLAASSFDMQTRIKLDLMVLRLRLVITGQEKEVLGELATYQEMISALSPLQSFNVFQMLGMALYAKGDLQGCLDAFTNANSTIEHLSLSPFERADFKYVYSVASMAAGRKYEALEQAKQALSYFQSVMAGQRVVECHLICGVSYKKSGQLTKALEILQLGEQICRQFDLHPFLGIVHQNIGDVYSVMGETEHAIANFKEAIKQKEEPLELMYSIFSLVKEYEKLRKYETALHWLSMSKRLLPKLSERKREYYRTHFDVYYALCQEEEGIEEEAFRNAVRIFKRRGNRKEWKDYAKRLAKFHAGKGSYKKAVFYYEMIICREGEKG